MNMFLDEMVSSTNMLLASIGLTANAIDAIEKSATDELKNLSPFNLWQMDRNNELTEPQCGTDLGLSKPWQHQTMMDLIILQEQKYLLRVVNMI